MTKLRKFYSLQIPYQFNIRWQVQYLFSLFWKVDKKMRVIYRLSFQYNSKWLYSISLEYFHGFITKQFNDLLPVGLLAQLIRVLHPYHRGQEVRIPVQAWTFFRLSFRNCNSCVYNCDDPLSCNWFFFIIINNFGASYLEVVIIQCILDYAIQQIQITLT